MQVVSESVERPRTDDREYRVIKLENGLEAMLIHDATTDKASAALDVHVGAYSDPEDLPGLAHFLEHLLFMGTEKYPSEKEYSEFLTGHSGSYNAYTSSEDTNYYFDVSWPHLAGALDRFSQFFIAPLFSESCKEREILAVDSENKKNLSNDTWRLNQLEKSLSNPEHPFHKFSTGNFETLGAIPTAKGLDVREELIKFYKSHYTSTLMKLVVLGRESLDELQEMVDTMFSAVPDSHNAKEQWSTLPVQPEQMGTLVKAKPVMDLTQLELRFLVPHSDQYYGKYPHNYYSHLIGHESEGSLLYYLKQQLWANSLSCGSYGIGSEHEFFTVEVDLTKAGLENWERIVRCIFEYIEMLRQEGPKPWIYDELERSSKAEFWYMAKIKPSTTASRYARVMQRSHPRSEILRGSIPCNYDAKALDEYLGYLSPQNVRLTLVSQTFDGLGSKEKWYGTEYSCEQVPELVESLSGLKPRPELHLPVRNQFVPEDFEVLATSTVVQRPTLVVRKPGLRVWFKKDDTFKMPKGQIYVKLTSAAFDKTVEAQMASELLVQVVNDALNDYTYYAEVAGLNYSLTCGQSGVEIQLGGFQEKLHTLLQVIIDTLKSAPLKEDRLVVLRERLARNIRNVRYDNPYKQLNTQTSMAWIVEGMWPWDERLAALEALDVAAVEAHRAAVFSCLDVELLVVGNFTVADSKKLASQVVQGLDASPLATKPFKDSYWLDDGGHYHFAEELSDKSEPNSAIDCRFQICRATDTQARTLLTLLCQIIKVPVFHTLRTKEQLGYIVGSYSRTVRGTIWLEIIAQSERPTSYLEERVMALLPELRRVIDEMSDAEFERNVAAVVDSELESFKSLRQEASSYWSAIIKGFYDFDRRRQVAALASKATKQQVLEFFDQHLGDRRRLFVVHLMSQGSGSTPAGRAVARPHNWKPVGLPQPVHDLEIYEQDEHKL